MDVLTPAHFVLGISLGLLAYAYAGYPVLLLLLSALRREREPRRADPARWPHVTVVISAHNEEAIIGRRIENLLDLDYPADRLRILIGSDGSTDRTSEVMRLYRTDRIEFHDFALQRGKANVLNDLLGRAKGEYVVFSDANTFFKEDAITELIRGFLAHPSACAVVGRLEFRTAEGTTNPDSLYWRYETMLKRLESRFGSVLGANGAIYAIKRRWFEPLPPGTIVDDFLVPMLMRLRRRASVIFRPSAMAWETVPETVQDEFRRRTRIGAGDAHALRHSWRLLLPRHGWLALSYWSHKVLRWMGPWLLISAFVSNLWLLDRMWGRHLFAAQVSAYVLGLSAPWLRRIPAVGRAATVASYFMVLNAALLVGMVKYTFGTTSSAWSRTSRTADLATIPLDDERRRQPAAESQADRRAA
ncbi:MAG TPA: glycosyltransferase family 2 protein [Nitrospira sp.]|nr:glycosyltransferase family 2 protein [Nitrospira sp.]